MSAKRTAPYTVDEKTHESVENGKDNNDATPQGEAHAPRTIVKVKKDEAEVKQPEPAEKKEEINGLLFQNLFKNNGVGLFNNSNLFPNPPTAKPDFKASSVAPNLQSPNLFTGNGFSNAKPSIFGKKDASEGLFKNSSEGLFKNVGGSIFGFGQGSNLPPVRSGAGEEEEDGDSAELEQKQNMPIDKSKSSGSYEYKEEMKILFTAHAKKYRKNNGDLIESVEVLVQTKVETNVSLLVVRLPATKHPIFTGFITMGSHVRVINSKQENIQIVAYSVEQGKKPTKDLLKLQFQTADVGKQFQEVANSLIAKDNNELGKKDQNGEAAKEKAKQSEPSQKKE